MAKEVQTKFRTNDICKCYCENCQRHTKAYKKEIIQATRVSKHAKVGVFILLLILGILPGIIYLIYNSCNKYKITEVVREQWVCYCCGLPDYLGEFQQWNVEEKTIVPMSEEDIKKNTKTIDLKKKKEKKNKKEDKESKSE